MYANYTWSKNMTNMQSSLEGDNGGRPLNFYNLALEKAVAQDDQPHLLKVFFSWDTPIGRGRTIGGDMPSWLSAVIGNWQVKRHPQLLLRYAATHHHIHITAGGRLEWRRTPGEHCRLGTQ